ncbi:protein of unknown function [Candidatus Hydrogenisulfobacillus filiaventi]|uniref:Uncharacterized protein n=1 Tax=Candidatus Hydrogenisulfobacillus filiaventi TaxID=2707344 RepID=A0A6F8ZID5_9FIRM|nr:protein of unknown function [Candidatus Hydrogenisulfobacillus filiaventi]
MRAMKTTGILVASGHPGLEARLRAECGPGLRTVPAWADLAQPAPAGRTPVPGVALPGLPEPEDSGRVVGPLAGRGGVVGRGAAGNWRQVLAGRPQWEVWTDRLDPGRLWAWCRAAGGGETPGLRPRRWGYWERARTPGRWACSWPWRRGRRRPTAPAWWSTPSGALGT